MLDASQLEALAAVLRAGSFEAAATRLGVTPSAVSQRIRGLEERVGAPLIRRGPPARPTEAGEVMLAHAETLSMLEREALQRLGGRSGPGAPIRIAVNADSLATWLIPALNKVDGVLFDIEIDDQEHSAHWLRNGQVAAAVTVAGETVQGCASWPLGTFVYRASANPGFARRWFPFGVDSAGLSRAPGLRYNGKDRLQADWASAITGGRIAMPEHRIGSTQGITEATLAGLGWGLNPAILVDGHISAGRLVDLDPTRPWRVPLTWQVSRLLSRPLAGVTAAVLAAARAALEQDVAPAPPRGQKPRALKG